MDIGIMFESFPKLLSATVITLKLLSLSLFFGLFIGLLFAILRLNTNPIINKFAYGYSYVFRGTPLLVQIFIIYFGLGQLEFFRTTFLCNRNFNLSLSCPCICACPLPSNRKANSMTSAFSGPDLG